MEESRSVGGGERERERVFSSLEGWGKLPIHSVGFNRTYSSFIIIS